MSSIEKTSIVKRVEHVASNEFSDESIILDLDSGDYYAAEGVAGFIWERLAEPASIEMLSNVVAESYDVEPAKALKDVCHFVSELLEAKIVEVAR